MSQENVEIVRRFVVSSLDEGWTDADPNTVWNPVDEPQVQGSDAARASLARWESTWDEYEVIPEDFVDVGDRVVVTVRMRGVVAQAASQSNPACTTSTHSAAA